LSGVAVDLSGAALVAVSRVAARVVKRLVAEERAARSLPRVWAVWEDEEASYGDASRRQQCGGRPKKGATCYSMRT
jgi:hypothetical protein